MTKNRTETVVLRANERLLRVTAITALTGRVRNVRLASVGQSPLPQFTPGSNLGLRWSPTATNSYSLVGRSRDPEEYEISVLAQPDGRGGSLWVHGLNVGDTVVSTGVYSAFPPIASARHHLLVAAGIGITPVLSHARWHAQWGNSFQVIYVHRPGEGVHSEELRELSVDNLLEFDSRADFWDAFGPVLANAPFATHLYTCGPLTMIDEVARAAQNACWPSERVHSEAFSALALDPGRPFRAVLRRTGVTLSVPSGASLLEAAEANGVKIANLCRQGLCGECRIPVLKGSIDHRDLVLSMAEKTAGTTMTACVSRAECDEIEVDL